MIDDKTLEKMLEASKSHHKFRINVETDILAEILEELLEARWTIRKIQPAYMVHRFIAKGGE